MCGPASSGAARDELAQALGCEIGQAAAMAGTLLSSPHPLVAAAGNHRTGAGPNPWRGLPIFSAWIIQPENADDPADPA